MNNTEQDDKAASWYGDTTPTTRDEQPPQATAEPQDRERPPLQDDPGDSQQDDRQQDASDQQDDQQDDQTPIAISYPDEWETELGIVMDEELAAAASETFSALGVEQAEADGIVRSWAEHQALLGNMPEQEFVAHMEASLNKIRQEFTEDDLNRAEALINNYCTAEMKDAINASGAGQDYAFVKQIVQLARKKGG
jgi:hypothetical protein